jgi:hypothetical protein
VQTLTLQAGQAHWNGRDAAGQSVPAGIYYVTAGDFVGRIIKLK